MYSLGYDLGLISSHVLEISEEENDDKTAARLSYPPGLFDNLKVLVNVVTMKSSVTHYIFTFFKSYD